MIPDCRKRLEIAVDDLLVYFNGLQNDQSVKETQEYTGAQEALAEAQEKLSAPVQV
ncbi:hypothetical protein BCV70DRAFT_197502 [Testicularia cyperi]|uniref:Tubulin-specific chaperone A n=1 Tax=Testicularia cyperi TaxID=1882483 RepID=A0A317XYC0_9BASI|nr:hypothetical protein BCV70DRAFT_197502 [Testicularia cyperi]